jgi:hypothetical protein
MTETNTARYDFPQHVKGDTFNGVQFTVTVNAVPLDLTAAHIKMDLRLTPLGVVAESFSDGAGITIAVNPATGVFKFDAQVVNIPAATYYYDIEITLSNGVIKTYVGGRWTILQDITYT